MSEPFRHCRNCHHWDGPDWPAPTPGLCQLGVSEFRNPDGLTPNQTLTYVREGEVCGCEGVTTPGFTCDRWGVDLAGLPEPEICRLIRAIS